VFEQAPAPVAKAAVGHQYPLAAHVHVILVIVVAIDPALAVAVLYNGVP